METQKQMDRLIELLKSDRINHCIMDHPGFQYTDVRSRTFKINSIELVAEEVSLLLANGKKVMVTEDNVNEMLTTRLF